MLQKAFLVAGLVAVALSAVGFGAAMVQNNPVLVFFKEDCGLLPLKG